MSNFASSAFVSTAVVVVVGGSNNTMTEQQTTRSSQPRLSTTVPSHVLQNCRDFAGTPLSRQQALAKMKRSPTFRQAALEFELLVVGPGKEDDIVERAIQLDYGYRIRSCLQGSPTKKISIRY
jgi:hypothetical protein